MGVTESSLNLAFAVAKIAVGSFILWLLMFTGVFTWLTGIQAYDLSVIIMISTLTSVLGWFFARIFLRRMKTEAK